MAYLRVSELALKGPYHETTLRLSVGTLTGLVTLVVDTGSASIQTYLTAKQCTELASQFLNAADKLDELADAALAVELAGAA